MEIIGDLTPEERADFERMMPAIDDAAQSVIVTRNDEAEISYLVQTFGEPGAARYIIHLDDLSYARLLREAGN